MNHLPTSRLESGGRPTAFRRRRVAVLGTVGAAAILVALAPVASAQSPSGTGWIRIGHFAPANAAVRVAIDGKVVDRNITFETVTPYRHESDGVHTVTLTDVGAPRTVLSERVTVTTGRGVTVGAVQTGHGVALESFVDDLQSGPAGDARVRVIDTAPGTPRLQVALTSEAKKNAPAAPVSTPVIGLGASSPYMNVPAGTYTVAVTNGNRRQILTGRDWPVVAGTVASVIVVQTGGQPTLEVIRDAAGSSDPPVGGMQTGFGGAARLLPGNGGSDDHGTELVIGLAAAAVLGLIAVTATRRRQGRPRRFPVAAASLVVLTAVGATACGSRPTSSGPTGPTASPTGPTATVAPPPAVGATSPASIGTGPAVDLSGAATATTAAAPTALSISSIGLRTQLEKLGRTATGAAEVPKTTDIAGWYTDSPAPGQPGPAVILGHVDSYKGPGVFFGLHELQPGAAIRITEGGRQLTFEVQQVRSFVKTSFPTAAVFGPTPDRALRLVTCGGTFDRSTGHYDDNVVVFATEVGGPSGAS